MEASVGDGTASQGWVNQLPQCKLVGYVILIHLLYQQQKKKHFLFSYFKKLLTKLTLFMLIK